MACTMVVQPMAYMACMAYGPCGLRPVWLTPCRAHFIDCQRAVYMAYGLYCIYMAYFAYGLYSRWRIWRVRPIWGIRPAAYVAHVTSSLHGAYGLQHMAYIACAWPTVVRAICPMSYFAYGPFPSTTVPVYGPQHELPACSAGMAYSIYTAYGLYGTYG